MHTFLRRYFKRDRTEDHKPIPSNIFRLIKQVCSTDVQELEITSGDCSIKINRQPINMPDTPNTYTIVAPAAGTFHTVHKGKRMVEIGRRINTGDAVCLVEAQDFSNQIDSEFDGMVREIKAAEDAPVITGQELIVLERV